MLTDFKIILERLHRAESRVKKIQDFLYSHKENNKENYISSSDIKKLEQENIFLRDEIKKYRYFIKNIDIDIAKEIEKLKGLK